MVSEKFTDNKKLKLYNNKKWQKKSESNRLIIIDALLEGHKGHNFWGGLPYMFLDALASLRSILFSQSVTK